MIGDFFFQIKVRDASIPELGDIELKVNFYHTIGNVLNMYGQRTKRYVQTGAKILKGTSLWRFIWFFWPFV
jgi:hypothetical protein